MTGTKANIRFLEAAGAIGARLAGEALWSGRRCNWLGDAMEFVDGQWQVVHRTCGVSLYDGTAGIALFLSRLVAVEGDHRGDSVLRATARGALMQANSRLHALPPPGRLGLYSGLVGVAHALTECGGALGDPDWVQRGIAIIDDLSAGTDDGEGLDIISGAAGAIPILLRRGSDQSRALARALGERLLTRARDVDGGMAWDTMPGSTRPLTGYSHGTAGLAVALQELSESTGDQRFAAAARGALTYERAHFVTEQGNWPDFRDFAAMGATPATDGGAVCSMAWCHGAPGIALSRLRLWELTGDSVLRDEARIALETTRRAVERLLAQPGFDCSLCHGLAGLAEPLLAGASALGEPSFREIAERVGDRLIEWYGRTGSPWPCGVPNGGETPALMTGVAGIGYFLLRLAVPDSTPSVLLFPGDTRIAALQRE
jgi:lantibiotic modifying enzyme